MFFLRHVRKSCRDSGCRHLTRFGLGGALRTEAGTHAVCCPCWMLVSLRLNRSLELCSMFRVCAWLMKVCMPQVHRQHRPRNCPDCQRLPHQAMMSAFPSRTSFFVWLTLILERRTYAHLFPQSSPVLLQSSARIPWCSWHCLTLKPSATLVESGRMCRFHGGFQHVDHAFRRGQ